MRRYQFIHSSFTRRFQWLPDSVVGSTEYTVIVIELSVLLCVQQIIYTDIIEKGSVSPGHTSRLGISLEYKFFSLGDIKISYIVISHNFFFRFTLEDWNIIVAPRNRRNPVEQVDSLFEGLAVGKFVAAVLSNCHDEPVIGVIMKI